MISILSFSYASTTMVLSNWMGGYNIYGSNGSISTVLSNWMGGYNIYTNNGISFNGSISAIDYSETHSPYNPWTTPPSTNNSDANTDTMLNHIDNAIIMTITGKSPIERCQDSYWINTTVTTSTDPLKDWLCTCKTWYIWSVDWKSCVSQTPINMCQYLFGPNVHTDWIENTDWTYDCYCNAGYTWGDTQKNCVYNPESITTSSTDNLDTELQDAYDYAYGIGITTATSIDNADMNWYLLRRAHMAKMMVNYAVDVLGLTPNTSKPCNFTDIANQSDELRGYITEACQLWLMGVGIDKFNPNGMVTRAEFGTVFSRALYGNAYNEGNPYYLHHLQALKDAGIMNDISNPNAREIRGYVMLMMKRADE